ncbi:MAG TPA: acyl-CoA ligase (AMP-forming), exosortase A system-associated [Steroidobacter sp.]|uniref:acyl-CoA ligase (AMP-forming), exosortase A system-associated n=1 Tax=Steroidobacter sp. TaxID=1978227 RepID=UPI002ED7A80A
MTLLHHLLDRSARQSPRKEAVRYRGEAVSYVALQDLSMRTAAGLQALDVIRGDRVVIFLPNRPEVVEIALACSRIGAIFIPVSPMLRSRQLTHILRDSGATTLVVSDSLLPYALPSIEDSPALLNVVLVEAKQAPRNIRSQIRHLRIEELRSYQPLPSKAIAIDRDLAAILYTSGSTGPAKGVMISHHNLVSGAVCVSEYLENTAEDRLLAALPLSFDYGLSQITTAFHVGACATLTNYSMPAAIVQEAAAEKITGLAGVPTMWAYLAAAEWPAVARDSLRYITNSGGALTQTLIRSLRTRLPSARLYCMYGLTEAFRSTYLDPEEIDRRRGSIGKAIPNQEILLVRPDGSRCEPGETGELVHRGSLVARGYWNNAEATAKRFRPVPAWVSTATAGEMAVWSGDLARTDADGYLYFVARADQLIKTSGYRVSSTEIEDIVSEVDGVIENVALGVADELLGQKIVVAVAGSVSGAEALIERIRRHCRLHLPPYMAPADIHVLEELPRNANGKPDRPALAKWIESSRTDYVSRQA